MDEEESWGKVWLQLLKKKLHLLPNTFFSLVSLLQLKRRRQKKADFALGFIKCIIHNSTHMLLAAPFFDKPMLWKIHALHINVCFERLLSLKFLPESTHKNWARGNRKTLKWPKMMSNTNFSNLKWKSYEEYLNCRTYFVK